MTNSTKRSFKLSTLFVAGSLFLAACGHAPTGNVDNGHVVVNGKATLMLVPRITSGGFKTQAVVNNYTKASINHLVIKVFHLNGDIELPVLDSNGEQVSADLLNSELDDPVAFFNLFRSTTYRIRCYAYKAPDTAAADLISTADHQSYVDVAVADDDRPTVANLKVKLIDVAFNGEATSSFVEVTDGGFVQNGPVTINRKPAATPAPTTFLANFLTGTLDPYGNTLANFVTIEEISSNATPGTDYRLRVEPPYFQPWDPATDSWCFEWGQMYGNEFRYGLKYASWIPGSVISIPGYGTSGTITIKLGARPDHTTQDCNVEIKAN